MVTLQGGTSSSGDLCIISGGSLYSLCTNQQCTFVGQLNYVVDKDEEKVTTTKEVSQLLAAYKFLFEEPNGLPPPTLHDQ